MKKINLIELDPEEFKGSIVNDIKSLLLNVSSQEQLLTREETAEYLSINLVTLWKWTRDGKLSSYGLGNRVYYKMADIQKALVNINCTNE